MILGIAAFLLSSTALAGNQAVVQELVGEVWAVDAEGVRRQLVLGTEVATSETLHTGTGSRVVLAFDDDSRFELGADAAMLVRHYVFKPRDPESRLVTRIFRGAFRFVSGAIARLRGEGMRVELSVATIGIRGTRVAGEADATSARVMLLEPEDDPARYTAIEVSNSFGSVVVDKPGWGTEVPDEYSPPTPPRRMQLDSINRLNRSMQTIRRVITPRMRPGM
ncbi:MAG: FecR domain-containing protein [Gammaproteobacteria bacterium]|nr:FecR domain-containing protein [Gammaproteobacteria bacterium]